MFDPKNPIRIYSGALASILYDVLDDVIVDASIHKFLFSEREAAKNLLLEEFNGTTTISINQEFFITMMYSNLSYFAKSYANS